MRKAVLVPIVLAGVLALSSCAQPTHGGDSTPKATPTPEKSANSDVFERTNPLPSDLSGFPAMTDEQFDVQPKAKQLEYASWLDQYKTTYETRYNGIAGITTPVETDLTASSTPAQKFEAFLNVQRMAASMDQSDADKYLIAHNDGALQTNPTIDSQLTSRKTQALKDGDKSFTAGEAIPVDYVAISDIIDRYYKDPSFITGNTINFEGAEKPDTTFVTFTDTTSQKQYRMALFVEPVKAYDGKTTYEVVSSVAKPVN